MNPSFLLPVEAAQALQSRILHTLTHRYAPRLQRRLDTHLRVQQVRIQQVRMGKYLRSQSRNLSQRPDILSCYRPSGSVRTPMMQPLLNARELETPKVRYRPQA